ncbi:MBL fold metallo-hydrolase [Erythrobacter sp. Alg231-14]|uniref:MBL fold metallo-hydrolase n=1 Tax=Erythrobacter sp. Alg231-14 TaxID=1922225 RepID=UPI000D55A4F6
MFEQSKKALMIVCGAAFAVASCGQSEAPPATQIAADRPVAGTATSILNAGVMTQMNGNEGSDVAGSADRVEGAKFLFDPLYDNHFGSLEQLPETLISAIVTGAAPYDNVDAVFVSHAHGDHFSASQLTAMMAAQEQVKIIAPAQAIDSMREETAWQPSFDDRVTAIALKNGESAAAFEVTGATVEAFRSPHNGWPDRHANTHNITFRVSVGQAGATARVMHLGDADPATEHYTALTEFMAAKRTGLAMVPFWFYQENTLSQIIDETLNAEASVAMHVPAQVPGFLNSADEPYFTQVGEVLEIVATP